MKMVLKKFSKGTEGNPSQALRDMLKYIEYSRQENIFNPDIASRDRRQSAPV